MQSTQIDLSKASCLVAATESTWWHSHADTGWEKLFTYAKSVAKTNSIDISDPVQSCRQRKIPCRFDDGIVYQSIGARDTLSTSQNYKVVLCFEDSLLNQPTIKYVFGCIHPEASCYWV